jgi:hypothetical protein
LCKFLFLLSDKETRAFQEPLCLTKLLQLISTKKRLSKCSNVA